MAEELKSFLSPRGDKLTSSLSHLCMVLGYLQPAGVQHLPVVSQKGWLPCVPGAHRLLSIHTSASSRRAHLSGLTLHADNTLTLLLGGGSMCACVCTRVYMYTCVHVNSSASFSAMEMCTSPAQFLCCTELLMGCLCALSTGGYPAHPTGRRNESFLRCDECLPDNVHLVLNYCVVESWS
jgi:hypothetical protein